MSFHHFVGEGMNRSEKIQAWIIGQLRTSPLPQSQRESSVPWELKHSSGVIQMARLLAQKRGVNEELAEIAAGLHDVHVIVNGTYTDHARQGAPLARQLLEESGQFAAHETREVFDAIFNHSDKHTYSTNPLVELIKDADTLDCFMYGDTVYDYKPPETRIHYYKRIVGLRNEFGLPPKPYFAQQIAKSGDTL